jgi:ADP-ribose pyrophosphatase YjhB (NUDIX family)
LGTGAILLDRDRVLLVERGREPLKGWWSLPGGVVEPGESLADAVRREVREETGLDVVPQGIVEVFERIIRDDCGRPEYHYVLVDYLCRVNSGELAAGDDVSRAAWVRRRDLSEFQITEGTVPVIEKAFRFRRSFGRGRLWKTAPVH